MYGGGSQTRERKKRAATLVHVTYTKLTATADSACYVTHRRVFTYWAIIHNDRASCVRYTWQHTRPLFVLNTPDTTLVETLVSSVFNQER